MTLNYINLIIFICSTFGLCVLILSIGFLLGSKVQSHSKNIPFESGINPVGTARLRFSIKFYLVALFFVIFDVETLYLYAWIISIPETGWGGFIEASIFIIILLISLMYLIRMNILNWTPKNY